MPPSRPDLDHALNSLRGVALGDSLGLVYEGLAATRGVKLYPPPWRQRLFFGRGLLSDDTVQSACVVAALARHPDDARAFQQDFAKRLRLWFLSVPPGIGLSTVKACLRLTVGLGPHRSGIYSAGNGSAMRSAVLGAAFAHDPAARIAFVEACSRVTHTHPLALAGSQLIALATALSTTGQTAAFEGQAKQLAPDWPWPAAWPARGPSGYVVHSVNAALSIWREASGWEDAMARVIQLGGDTDTVGAMVGGIMGASDNFTDLPAEWERTIGWPQRRDYAAIRAGRGPSYLGLLGANLLGIPVVLAHGFRRLFPPYAVTSTRRV
jgi:ADP-ribosyl-[dinitrogen reductase] hydrolase